MVSNPDGHTGERAVHYIGPGHTRVIYEDRILNIKFKESPQKYISKVRNRQSNRSYAELPPEIWDARDEAIAKARSQGAVKGAKTRKANRIKDLKEVVAQGKALGEDVRKEEIALYKLQGKELPKRLTKKAQTKKKTQAKKQASAPAKKSEEPARKKKSGGKSDYQKMRDYLLSEGYPPFYPDGSPLSMADMRDAYEECQKVIPHITRQNKGIITY